MAETEVVPSESPGQSPVAKVTLGTLTAMVVGSMIGAGVFSLPARFGSATGVVGAIVAWTIAGLGMLMLAFVFQNLALRKPHLDAGLFAYAREGFGDYVGFNAALGFWASACVGNTFYWVFIMTTVGRVWPGLGKGDTLLAVVLSSVGVWTFHYLIARGVKEATTINRIVTVAKVIPILVFILVVALNFSGSHFHENFWGGQTRSLSTVYSQVRGTMIITTFVFLGIEGATVYSRYARRREDVGKATVFGFLSVLSIFALVTLLSYGVMPTQELANQRQPSMASVLSVAAGGWGSWFIEVGVVISVLGAYLAWTLMAAEMMYIPATAADMPAFLKRLNHAATPIAALILSSLLVQLFIVVTLTSDDALNFMLDLCTSLSLVPYFLAAAYGLKIAQAGDTYEGQRGVRTKQWAISAVATVYTLFLVYAAGVKFVLLGCIIYAPGTILYVMARRENDKQLFTRAERLLCGALVVGAVAGIAGLISGGITI
jgi:arginine:ornithine antiporter/lysine permease